jgi:hypothetical protein
MNILQYLQYSKIRKVDQDTVEVHRSLVVRKVMLIHWQLDCNETLPLEFVEPPISITN